MQLCQNLAHEFPKQDVELLAMNGVCYLNLDFELLQCMKQAGFTHLNLSLVSLDERVCHCVKRPYNPAKYCEVVESAAKLGFEIVSYQILGLPGESIQSMIETLVYMAGLPVLIGASPFYLTPNSHIANFFPPLNLGQMVRSRLTDMGMEISFPREDIYTLFITARILNFFKGLLIPTDEVSFSQALEIAKTQGKRACLGAQVLQRLFSEKILYVANKKGFFPVKKFQWNLFLEVWFCLKKIQTQHQKWIQLA
jgi:hypothetical protein